MKRCPDCSTYEERTIDKTGIVTTNLDPVTGCCLPCLIQRSAGAKVMTTIHPGRDVKRAQAGEREND